MPVKNRDLHPAEARTLTTQRNVRSHVRKIPVVGLANGYVSAQSVHVVSIKSNIQCNQGKPLLVNVPVNWLDRRSSGLPQGQRAASKKNMNRPQIVVMGPSSRRPSIVSPVRRSIFFAFPQIRTCLHTPDTCLATDSRLPNCLQSRFHLQVHARR